MPIARVQRLLAAQGVPGWPQAGGDIRPVGPIKHQFDEETRAPMVAISPSTMASRRRKLAFLQGQHDQGIEGGEDHPGGNRDSQQQVEGQRRAEHLGKVGGDDRQLRQQPLATRHARAVALLGELRGRAGGDPQARTEALQEHPGKARQHHHERQRVAEARARLDGGGPVAGSM